MLLPPFFPSSASATPAATSSSLSTRDSPALASAMSALTAPSCTFAAGRTQARPKVSEATALRSRRRRCLLSLSSAGDGGGGRFALFGVAVAVGVEVFSPSSSSSSLSSLSLPPSAFSICFSTKCSSDVFLSTPLTSASFSSDSSLNPHACPRAVPAFISLPTASTAARTSPNAPQSTRASAACFKEASWSEARVSVAPQVRAKATQAMRSCGRVSFEF